MEFALSLGATTFLVNLWDRMNGRLWPQQVRSINIHTHAQYTHTHIHAYTHIHEHAHVNTLHIHVILLLLPLSYCMNVHVCRQWD
ncbi:hypothetical protein EON63_23400 [archaeon]|nr:MAG: hypothetical protein EON63_23400 [archaeon]